MTEKAGKGELHNGNILSLQSFSGKTDWDVFTFSSSASSSSKGVVGLDDVMSEVSMVGEKWAHKLHPGHTSCLMYVSYSFPTSFIVRKLYRSKVQWKSTPSSIPHSIFCTYFLRCDQNLSFFRILLKLHNAYVDIYGIQIILTGENWLGSKWF